MRQFIKLTLVLMMSAVITGLSLPSAAAAATTATAQSAPGQATLTVKATVDQPEIFWKYTFLTKDSDLGKPADIKLVWSFGQTQIHEKTETIVNAGKDSGQLSLVTEKGALVNILLSVRDSKNVNLGSINLQVRNNGQTESISFTPPEFSEPKITWSNL
ncbi:MAG: hypothetical protein ABFC57_03635 [Veillonellales bacterium]